ncbi:MAG: hypothetical protein WDO72_12090 [Pseudomonadota bacterium]
MSFHELDNRIHPKSHISELRGLLPEKYSPLRANGDGLQSVYLAEVGRPFAAALFRLIGGEANKVADVAKEGVTDMSPSRGSDLERWEEAAVPNLRKDTEKLLMSRSASDLPSPHGQGRHQSIGRCRQPHSRRTRSSGNAGC